MIIIFIAQLQSLRTREVERLAQGYTAKIQHARTNCDTCVLNHALNVRTLCFAPSIYLENFVPALLPKRTPLAQGISLSLWRNNSVGALSGGSRIKATLISRMVLFGAKVKRQ